MQISNGPVERTCAESEIYNELLSIDNSNILELGCGAGELTREIATNYQGTRILATEVDAIQHGKNSSIDDLPNVHFEFAGAQSIPAEDNSFDIVFMFKSLHHVPVELMGQALDEIHRVLKPGGHAYISEPIFAGDFNELLRLFNDEQAVRAAAFAALESAVESGRFELVDEVFFNVPAELADFDTFEERVIGATHTDHRLSDDLYQSVKAAFFAAVAQNGGQFKIPVRVDLLRKPLAH